ncbi:hypothetical protein [Paenibacillus sp. S150]|uniref:hypothetical protein n=1 Tax=Paenibacillus sp. S150 TaxID=2749826 RepID=UPI001C59BF6E|nr:hypothetical protein [Paenibacillus sp. S150]MBW4085078.1 hypothetical protein [Paenibacillus sp. S150]
MERVKKQRALHKWRHKGILLLLITLLAPLLPPGTGQTAEAAGSATVTVDAGSDLGKFNNPVWYQNQADYSPDLGAGDMAKVQALGVKYTRAWIKPTKYYNEANGTYSYNYIEHEGNTAYSYMDQIALHSDRIFLNIDQCSTELTYNQPALAREVLKNGIRHYKQRYPQIEYIEAFNEPKKSWTPGYDEAPNMEIDTYYYWYKQFYAIVQELNAELNPAIPLKIGGPASVSLDMEFNQQFLNQYAADTNPNKRLDFFSYHSYNRRSNPADVQSDKATVQGWLSARGLNPNTPVFVTEYGVFPGSNTGTTYNEDLLTQAAAMSALGYYFVKGGMDMPMHWVFDHANNNRKSMFADEADGAPYPYYNLVKMQSMLKENRITTSSNALSGDGLGIHALGTRDDTGVAVLASNYQWTTGTADYNLTMNITNLPSIFTGKQIRVQRYLVDQTHSNYTSSGGSAELEKVADYIAAPAVSIAPAFTLGKNAMTLVVLTPVHHGEAEDLPAAVSAGAVQTDVADSSASGGAFSKFDGTASGQYVEYTMNVPNAGMYAVYATVKKGSDRGKFQLSVDGQNVGEVKDYYASSQFYDTYYIGNKNFGITGERKFRFTAAGSTGGGYDLGVDSIQLIPRRTITFEAESLTPWSTSGDPFTYLNDTGASGGRLVKLDTNAAGDDMQFNVNITQTGTYSIKVGVKKYSTRGKFQLSVDGVNVGGQQDLYAAGNVYEELAIGTYTFQTTGNKRIKFYVNGKNPSSTGYDLSVDYIRLIP